MFDTDTAVRTCTVRQPGSLDNEPFELPIGDRDDLTCGCPGCSEAVDDQLRLELPGIEQGMAVPFANAGFCSVDCLREFHDALPLVDVPSDEAESPVRHTLIEPATLVVVHAAHDGTRLQSFAGFRLASVLEDVAAWASENGYVGDLQHSQLVVADALADLGALSLTFEVLGGS